jgi:hypothetical protein
LLAAKPLLVFRQLLIKLLGSAASAGLWDLFQTRAAMAV